MAAIKAGKKTIEVVMDRQGQVWTNSTEPLGSSYQGSLHLRPSFYMGFCGVFEDVKRQGKNLRAAVGATDVPGLPRSEDGAQYLKKPMHTPGPLEWKGGDQLPWQMRTKLVCALDPTQM